MENQLLVEKEEVFKYLDTLRETGETNMYGAGVWIQAAYFVGKREAAELLKEWMDTFEERHAEPED